jgi:hypothetical protein
MRSSARCEPDPDADHQRTGNAVDDRHVAALRQHFAQRFAAHRVECHAQQLREHDDDQDRA